MTSWLGGRRAPGCWRVEVWLAAAAIPEQPQFESLRHLLLVVRVHHVANDGAVLPVFNLQQNDSDIIQFL